MALGTNRIKDLVPAGCPGQWGYEEAQAFGWTLYDPVSGTFTLQGITVQVTDPSGTTTEEVIHDGTSFQGDWAAKSSFDPTDGVTVVGKSGGFPSGTVLRFQVQSTDGTNSAFSSFYVGIGTPPGTGDPPAVGQVVRGPGGSLYEIIEVVGQAGDVRYRVQARDRTRAGVMLLRPNEFSIFPASSRLDDRIILSE